MSSKLKKIGRVVGVAAIILGVLFAGLVCVTWNVRVPGHVSREARFEKLPDDDVALANWIRAQPNVYKRVAVARLDPDRKRLVIWIPVSFHLWRHTPIPDLDNNVSRFGYLEPDGAFRLSAEDSLSGATASDDP